MLCDWQDVEFPVGSWLVEICQYFATFGLLFVCAEVVFVRKIFLSELTFCGFWNVSSVVYQMVILWRGN